MTQAEKLEALIRKASWFKATDSWNVKVINDRLFVGTETEWHTDEDFGLAKHMYSWQEILFNKDFARALFGEKTVEDLYREDSDEYLKVAKAITWVSGYEWDYEAKMFELYLQGAVISDDPVDYMYKAVFGDN